MRVYKPNINDVVLERIYFGLVSSLTVAYGNVKTEDDQMCEFLRNFASSGNPEAECNGDKCFIDDTCYLNRWIEGVDAFCRKTAGLRKIVFKFVAVRKHLAGKRVVYFRF